MHVWMIDQVARPGVQDAHQTDLPADMARIKRKFLCSFGGRLKEQGIQGFLVGTHQIAQLGRQCESQKEIRDRQE